METLTADRFTLLTGGASLSVYQWNTKKAKHYFCKVCGIYTHHQRRIDSNQFGFNIGCLDDVDPFGFENIGMVDGASGSIVKTETGQGQ